LLAFDNPKDNHKLKLSSIYPENNYCHDAKHKSNEHITIVTIIMPK